MSHPIHKMQRYVLGGVGLVSAMVLSFPIAMARVSATKEFPGQAVKSYDCMRQPQKEVKVVIWAKDCASLKVEPKKAEVKPAEAKPIEAKPATLADKLPEKAVEKAPEKVPEPETLRSGMTGPEVMILQEQLRSAGVFEGEIDGVFGQETAAAVQMMQERLKLEPNGVADSALQTAIGDKN